MGDHRIDSGFQILISLPLVLAKKDNWVAERPNKTLVRDALLRRPPHSVALDRKAMNSQIEPLEKSLATLALILVVASTVSWRIWCQNLRICFGILRLKSQIGRSSPLILMYIGLSFS